MTFAARWAIVGILVASLVLVAALIFGGAAPQPVAPGLPDAGPFVGWALPWAILVGRIAACGTVGFLLAASVLLPNRGDTVEGLSVVAVTRAGRVAAAWFLVSLIQFVLAAAEVFGRHLLGLTPMLIWTWAADTDLGRALLVQAVGAGSVAFACRWTLNVRWLSGWCGVSLLTMLPVALTGHAAVVGAHDLATVSLFVHVAAASMWIGGLGALVWVASRGSKRLPTAISRYSTLAAWAFVTVAVAGLVNASVRIAHWGDLTGTRYGVLVLAKATMLIALGACAWRIRRRAAAGDGAFLTLALVELLLMGSTLGLAVALGRTPPPVSTLPPSTTEELLGGPLPPAPTLGHLLFGWEPTGVATAVVLLGASLYIAGLRVLHRRGDSWPLGRIGSWFAGLMAVAWAGMGGLSQYAHVLFSAHMGSHMVLGMVAPILLVLGAPVTLALRTLPGPRQPGEVSPRALLTGLLRSPVVRVVTHPVVGPALFVGSLFVLYFTPLFSWLMQSHWGHGAMQLHFLVVGSLYYYVIIGVDPSPRTLPPIIRFAVLMFTIPFHAFFSVALMSAKTVIAQPYWAALHRPYQTDLLADQYLGGGIAWAMGEVPLVLVFGALFVQWIKSDLREAKRRDRAAERDGDAELDTYNARLRALSEKPKA